jgi:Uma2 family endonuclease
MHAIVADAPANPEPAPMAVPLIEPWTIEQADRLPDDGNRYEILAGELLVTPRPSEAHEAIVAWLDQLIIPFVRANGLGWVQHPRAVVQIGETRLEPDLMVRPEAQFRGWANAPLPILVVEVLSAGTRERDTGSKQAFYRNAGIPEYWIVDREDGVVIQVRGADERRISTILRWSPPATSAALEIDVARMFAEIRYRLTTR